MIETIVIWGRALGIVLAAVPAFCVAIITQFVLVQWRTMRSVWVDRPDARSPQQIIIDEEREKREQEVKDAQKRQVDHIKKMRTAGRVTGAIAEMPEAILDRIRGGDNDADNEE